LVAGDEIEMAAMLYPLGLHRERTIKRTAAGFLSTAWTGGEVGAMSCVETKYCVCGITV
jgi:hypothetical protein